MYLCTRIQGNKKDSIAQLVEHNTFNVGVLGSSPSRVTFFILWVVRLDSSVGRAQHF